MKLKYSEGKINIQTNQEISNYCYHNKYLFHFREEDNVKLFFNKLGFEVKIEIKISGIKFK
jgi:hypothetical protein